MINKTKVIFFFLILININNYTLAENNFFEEGKKMYNKKKYEESKFLFQRSIVFDPKNQNSYLYLAKIYKFQKNSNEEQKNINTVLLLNPKNEEANYMLMEIELKKSDYLKVRELIKLFLLFQQVC